MAQREVFISTLFNKAMSDKDIYFLAVDHGAEALDQWREQLPEQFIALGISEQNTINVAAGLSAAGKKVYVYFMACWVGRCFEQIRYSCAMGKSPITILGGGPALGYTPAGPAHSPTEDLAYMRSLARIEIFSPANDKVAEQLVDLTNSDPKLRYIRLERSYPKDLDSLYSDLIVDNAFLQKGFYTIRQPPENTKSDVCIVSNGYMLGRALKLAETLETDGYRVSVLDLFKLKSIDLKQFSAVFQNCDNVVTLEEQFLSGGLGSYVCETLADLGIQKRILRIGLPERYIFENGSREELLDSNGLSIETIYNNVFSMLNIENTDENGRLMQLESTTGS